MPPKEVAGLFAGFLERSESAGRSDDLTQLKWIPHLALALIAFETRRFSDNKRPLRVRELFIMGADAGLVWCCCA
jgi:hypothetical protein